MYHAESVFASIPARKAPVITYKRRQKAFGNTHTPSTPTAISTDSTLFGATPLIRDASPLEEQQTAIFKPNSPTERNRMVGLQQTDIARTCPTSTVTADLQTTRSPTVDIFDFPDVYNNDTEVELRIAFSLHSNGTKANKHTSKKTSTKATKAIRVKTSTSTSNKTVKIGSATTNDTDSNKNNTTNINRKNTAPSNIRVTANNSTVESQSIWDIPTDSGMISKSSNKPTSTKRPSSFHRTLSAPTLNTISSPLIYTQPMPQTLPPHDVKKRKRNLVSQLKDANGERLDFCNQPTGLRFYNMSSDSDDTEDDSTANATHSTENQPTSSNNQIVPDDYNERMEQELADLMRTEFGQLDEPDNLSLTPMLPLPSSSSSSSSSASSSTTQRPSYVPENSIRAPVTYKRFHNKSSLSAQSTHQDLEMEQQIQYLLSNDL